MQRLTPAARLFSFFQLLLMVLLQHRVLPVCGLCLAELLQGIQKQVTPSLHTR